MKKQLLVTSVIALSVSLPAFDAVAAKTPKAKPVDYTMSSDVKPVPEDYDPSADRTKKTVQEETDKVKSDAKTESEAADNSESSDSNDSKSSSSSSNPDAKLPHGVQFGVGVNATSGANVFVGYANKNFDSFWWKRVGVRLDFGTTSPLKSTINSAIDSAIGDGVDVGDGMTIKDAHLSANHFGALVDLYPFGNTWFLGGIRLTGGYMTGKASVSADLTGKVDSAPGDPIQFELDGIQYRYNGNTLNGTAGVNWNYSGPYLGTGFDLGLVWGIKIYMDAGVVFTDKTPHAKLNVPIDNLQVNNGTESSPNWQTVEGNSTYTQDFYDARDTALRDANDSLKDAKFYPIIKLGLMYRF